MGKNRFSRMLHLLTALQSGEAFQVEDLAKIVGVCRQTVFRDLELLRKCGVPVEYIRDRRCYAVDSSFFMPAVNLDATEALGLLTLVFRLRDQVPLPLANAALQAAYKVRNALPEDVRKLCGRALAAIEVDDRAVSDASSLDRCFLRLVQAIMDRRYIRVRYIASGTQSPVIVELQPCRVFYGHKCWRLLARTQPEERAVSIPMDDITHLQLLDRVFVPPRAFDVSSYLTAGEPVDSEKQLHHVSLRFSPETAESVASVEWHKSQTVTFEDDGSAVVEFQVDGLTEIVWWVLRYGDQVQVLSPKTLRDRVIEAARRAVRAHEDANSA